MAYGVSAAGWVAAHTAVKTLIFTGAGTASVKVFNSANALLAEATLNSATSAVDAAGNLNLTVLEQELSAPLGGTADHAHICDAGGVAVFQLPCEQGAVAVAGKCIINTLAIVAGAPVDFLSITVPAGATFT